MPVVQDLQGSAVAVAAGTDEILVRNIRCFVHRPGTAYQFFRLAVFA
jgi:hypothetical protein